MDSKENEKVLALIHAHLDEAAFADAWQAGRKMSLEEVVAYALGTAEDSEGRSVGMSTLRPEIQRRH